MPRAAAGADRRASSWSELAVVHGRSGKAWWGEEDGLGDGSSQPRAGTESRALSSAAWRSSLSRAPRRQRVVLRSPYCDPGRPPSGVARQPWQGMPEASRATPSQGRVSRDPRSPLSPRRSSACASSRSFGKARVRVDGRRTRRSHSSAPTAWKPAWIPERARGSRGRISFAVTREDRAGTQCVPYGSQRPEVLGRVVPQDDEIRWETCSDSPQSF